MTRIDHFNDPGAPRPTRLVPAASAVVVDDEGRLLLAKRTDNSLWTIPGGTMKPGESIAETAIREVKEETGLEVEVVSLVGIYSNPNHIVEYSDGEVRQQFSVCFTCRRVGGELAASDETSEIGYFSPADLKDLNIHPSIRLRIEHFLEKRAEPYLG
ncbi:MAG: NUDIX domain-containing protein [Acidimicrobiia bacterium]